MVPKVVGLEHQSFQIFLFEQQAIVKITNTSCCFQNLMNIWNVQQLEKLMLLFNQNINFPSIQKIATLCNEQVVWFQRQSNT